MVSIITNDDARESVDWMLRAPMTIWWPKEKKNIVKNDWDELAKDLPIIKSVFSLEQKNGESVNIKTYLGLMGQILFIESF